jgi:hypothetical protein
MVLKQVGLLGAAVYTRALEPGKDYDWYVKTGDFQLFTPMEAIQRLALRNISSNNIPKLAVLIERQRIGLLLAEMPSQRIDHSNRIIHDTFYLEFDNHYQRSVLHAVAVLLLASEPHYSTLETHFIDYAERLFYNASASSQQILTTIALPVVNQQPDFSLALITLKKTALLANVENRNRCARYLINFEARQHGSFILVSTDRLNLEKSYQLAQKASECLLLTLSTEIPTEVDLSKGRLSLALKQMINLTKSKRLSGEEE